MTTTAKKPKQPVTKMIRVDLTKQTLEAFEGSTRVFSYECVSGDKSHPTDMGFFSIFRKNHPYRSKTYNVQMDYAMFFTKDGKAIHQYHGAVPLSVVRTARSKVSDWFGSHGCVRLTKEDAKALYDWAPAGTQVHIS